MRAHKLSWKILAPALAWRRCCCPRPSCTAIPMQSARASCRRPPARDTGDCDDNHHPCRTLNYALTQVAPGNAIKLAAGSYDVSGIDVENLLIGKEGVRGGYSAEDHFAIQNAETNPTRVSGVADAFRNNFIAHGFIVVDANGDPLPRIIMPKLRGAHRLHQRHGGHVSLPQHRLSRAGAAAGNSQRAHQREVKSGASSISTTVASTPSSAIAMARRSMT